MAITFSFHLRFLHWLLHMPKGTLRCLISLLVLDMCLSKKTRLLLTFLVSVCLLRFGFEAWWEARGSHAEEPEKWDNQITVFRVNTCIQNCMLRTESYSISSANKRLLLIWILQNIKLILICMFTNKRVSSLTFKRALPGWKLRILLCESNSVAVMILICHRL